MIQLTKEQAIACADNELWKSLDMNQRASFQLQQNLLCMPFEEFHKAVEKSLGRPVFTHELGMNREGLIAELQGKSPTPSFEQIINILQADKTVVIMVKSS